MGPLNENSGASGERRWQQAWWYYSGNGETGRGSRGQVSGSGLECGGACATTIEGPFIGIKMQQKHARDSSLVSPLDPLHGKQWQMQHGTRTTRRRQLTFFQLPVLTPTPSGRHFLQGIHVSVVEHIPGAEYLEQNVVTAPAVVVVATRGSRPENWRFVGIICRDRT